MTILDGTNNAFDGSMVWDLRNSDYEVETDENGRELNFGVQYRSNGIATTRSAYVSDSEGWARFLDTMTNLTDEVMTVSYTLLTNLGDRDSVTVADGDGDLEVTPDDAWMAAGRGDGSMHFSIVAHDGRSTAPSAFSNEFSDNTVEYDSILLQPGESVSLLSFAMQNLNAADAAADAQDMSTTWTPTSSACRAKSRTRCSISTSAADRWT